MAKVEMDLLTDEGNNAVVQLPGRKYPGVLIQGDTLNRLVTSADDAMKAVTRGDVGKAEVLLQEVREIVRDAQTRYETALRRRGIELPY